MRSNQTSKIQSSTKKTFNVAPIQAAVDAPVIKVESRSEKIIEGNFMKHKPVTEPDFYVYRLVKRDGAVRFISPVVTVFDKEMGIQRKARYVKGEETIWENEQDGFSRVSPAETKFIDGTLNVSKFDPMLKLFMDLHPDNVANGGSVFELYIKEQTAEKTLETEFLVSDATNIIKNKTVDDLLPIAKHYGIDTRLSPKEIKLELVHIAKNRPADFIKQFDNPLIKIEAYVNNAIDFNIISIVDDVVLWHDTRKPIINGVAGRDIVQTFSMYLASDEGADVLSSIKDQLKDAFK